MIESGRLIMVALTGWLLLRQSGRLAVLTFGPVQLLWFGTVSGQSLQTQMAGGGGWWRKGPPVERISRTRS